MSRKVATASFILATAWLLVHAFLPGPNGPYDYVMSYNEWWYSGVAEGQIEDPFLPPGLVLMAGWIGWPSLMSLRLASFVGVVLLAWVFVKQNRPYSGVLLLSLPWFVVWAGRGQTDALMSALALGGVLIARYGLPNATGVTSFWGGFLVGLSAFVKPTGILAALGLPWRDWRPWAGLSVGVIPFTIWVITRPGHVWAFHAGSSVPFGNTILNLSGLLLGGAGIWYLLATRRLRVERWQIPMLAAFALFAFWKAPIGHEYYLLPALATLTLGRVAVDEASDWVIAANGLIGVALAVWFEM